MKNSINTAKDFVQQAQTAFLNENYDLALYFCTQAKKSIPASQSVYHNLYLPHNVSLTGQERAIVANIQKASYERCSPAFVQYYEYLRRGMEDLEKGQRLSEVVRLYHMYNNPVTLNFFNEIGVLEIFRLFENQYQQHRYELQTIPQYQQALLEAEAFKRKLVNNSKFSNLQESSDFSSDSLIGWATDESIFSSHPLNEAEVLEAEGDDLFDQAELQQSPDRQVQLFIQAAEKYQQAVIQRCRLFSEHHSVSSLSDIRPVFDEALHHSDKVKSLRLSACYAYENIVELSGDENCQALYTEKALQGYSLYIDTQRYYEKKWHAKGEYGAKNFEGLKVPVLFKSRFSFFENPRKGQLEVTQINKLLNHSIRTISQKFNEETKKEGTEFANHHALRRILQHAEEHVVLTFETSEEFRHDYDKLISLMEKYCPENNAEIMPPQYSLEHVLNPMC